MREQNVPVVPRRILASLISSLSAGVVPRAGAPYIAIGREVMLYSLMIERPVVVLPQPDSPTRPKTSPRLTSKLTSSTALTDLKYWQRCSTLSNTSSF